MINKIGAYRIIKEISEGGMAVVYLAVHKATSKKVAIKLLKERLITKEKIAQRFAQEGLLKLDDPNIVKIHSVGTHKNTPYIIMDYIEGIDLEEFIKKRGKLSFDKAMEIFTQILSALSYVHKKGIIHRDIKPKNILIDKNDNPYLTDFGIAKSLYSHIKTSTGGYLGAPAYSSPEQMDGKQVDERSDIYSLGITLYQMLTGRIPYSSSSIEIIIKEKFLNQIIPIEKRRKNIPSYIVSVINKCISKNPSNRFSSVEEITKFIKSEYYGKETIIKPTGSKEPKKTQKGLSQFKRPIIIFSSIAAVITIMIISISLGIKNNTRGQTVENETEQDTIVETDIELELAKANTISIESVYDIVQVRRGLKEELDEPYIEGALDDCLLLDVRTEEEYNEGHIEGALLIPVQELEDRLDELADYESIILCGTSGNKSKTAAEILTKNDFTSVYDMGDIISWIEADFPVVKEAVQIGEINLDYSLGYILKLVGDTIFISYENNKSDEIDDTGIHIVNVSDKKNPSLLSTINRQGLNEFTIEEDYIYYCNNYTDYFMIISHHSWSTGGIYIYDISDKEKYFLKSSYESKNTYWDFYVRGDFAYLLINGALYSIDLSDDKEINIIGELKLDGGFSSSIDIKEVEENYLYLYLSRSQFYVVDISDRSKPKIVKEVKFQNPFLFDLQMDGLYAYAITYDENVNSIEIYDFYERENPVFLSSVKLKGNSSMMIEKDYIYVRHHGSNEEIINIIDIIDVSDKTNPSIIGSIKMLDRVGYIFIKDNYMYVSYYHDYAEGSGYLIDIVDISNKKNPLIIGSIRTPESYDDIHIEGNYIYAINETREGEVFHIMELSRKNS
jgi:serine/threonine protein kinase/rhodanese-related sulfurtransferase